MQDLMKRDVCRVEVEMLLDHLHLNPFMRERDYRIVTFKGQNLGIGTSCRLSNFYALLVVVKKNHRVFPNFNFRSVFAA
jgi:hypothetical protein